MNHLSYWEQLKHLRMYSLERRRERYRIIYVWRVLEGQVPNIGNNRIISKDHERRGRECFPPNVIPGANKHVQSLIYASLPVHGQNLFNCIPKSLRNIKGCKVDVFKRELDKFLMTVPDEPRIPNYEKFCRTESNSLIYMTKLVYKPGVSKYVSDSPPTMRCDPRSLPWMEDRPFRRRNKVTR